MVAEDRIGEQIGSRTFRPPSQFAQQGRSGGGVIDALGAAGETPAERGIVFSEVVKQSGDRRGAGKA